MGKDTASYNTHSHGLVGGVDGGILLGGRESHEENRQLVPRADCNTDEDLPRANSGGNTFMKKPKCPCYKCSLRELGCQDTCEKLKEYEKEKVSYKAFVQANRNFAVRK